MSRSMAAAGILAVVAFAGAAHAEPVAYTWTGFGKNISGNSKCSSYKATLDMVVDGDSVKGIFQHEGRPERRFEATIGKGGKVKTKDTGGTNRMSVEAVFNEKSSTFEIFGYCLFEGKLTKNSRQIPKD